MRKAGSTRKVIRIDDALWDEFKINIKTTGMSFMAGATLLIENFIDEFNKREEYVKELRERIDKCSRS